jgi:hypothetical protein
MSTTNTEDAMRWGPPPDRRRWQQVADAAETVTNDQAVAEKIATAVMASFAPDVSPGDVISAEPDGTIVLDDGITTWNPARACSFLLAQLERRERGARRQEGWKLRQAVGRWWRIKVEQDNMDTSYLRSALGDKYYGTVMQIAADIEHSSLLQRLLGGEEPEDR